MDFSTYISKMEKEIVQATLDLVKIKSVKEPPSQKKPFGNGISAALDCILRMAAEMGFKTYNLDGYIGYAEYGEGENYIAAIGHIDTVEEGRGWLFPPYGAEINNGNIYGRGTLDNKGPVVASLFALKAIKDSGISLSRKIRIIFGTDEENNFEDMLYYLRKEKPPLTGFTMDGNFPAVYAEKGYLDLSINKKFINNCDSEIISINSSSVINTVPAYCEALIYSHKPKDLVEKISRCLSQNSMVIKSEVIDDKVLIKSYGIEAHASVFQYGVNAIQQIIKLLRFLEIGNDAEKKALIFIGEKICNDSCGKALGIEMEDEFSGKLSLNIAGINLDNGTLSVRLNIRYPALHSCQEIIDKIKFEVNIEAFEVDNITSYEPVYFQKEHFLIKQLMKTYREESGDYSDPVAISGGTYSKIIPNVANFGPVFPGHKDIGHEPNEYIPISHLLNLSRIYARALYELSENI